MTTKHAVSSCLDDQNGAAYNHIKINTDSQENTSPARRSLIDLPPLPKPNMGKQPSLDYAPSPSGKSRTGSWATGATERISIAENDFFLDIPDLCQVSLVPLHLRALMTIGIPDLLGLTEVCSVEELARRTNTKPGILYRILRGVSCRGVFRELPNKNFCHTPSSRSLLEGQTGRAWIDSFWGPAMISLHAHSGLVDILKGTHDSGLHTKFGGGLFVALDSQETAHERKAFNALMTEYHDMNRLIADGLDWSVYGVLADVGCGKGHVTKEILRTYPGINGILCDLPCVMEEAKKEADVAALGNRLSFRDGNFFEDLPNMQPDALFMKWIIHDWTDELCVKILSNCKKVMKKGAELILCERIVNAKPNVLDYHVLEDVTMMAILGGKERTQQEFDFVLNQAGFRLKCTNKIAKDRTNPLSNMNNMHLLIYYQVDEENLKTAEDAIRACESGLGWDCIRRCLPGCTYEAANDPIKLFKDYANFKMAHKSSATIKSAKMGENAMHVIVTCDIEGAPWQYDFKFDVSGKVVSVTKTASPEE